MEEHRNSKLPSDISRFIPSAAAYLGIPRRKAESQLKEVKESVVLEMGPNGVVPGVVLVMILLRSRIRKKRCSGHLATALDFSAALERSGRELN